MKSILCLALIATCVFAIDHSPRQTTFIQTKSAPEAAKENEMKSLVLALSQIHMSTEGPIDDLINALDDLVTWENRYLQLENQGFFMAQRRHDSLVGKLEAEIEYAQSDITSTQSLLESILYPQKASFEATIAQLQQYLADNEDTTARETQQRADEHDVWVSKDAEYSAAIDACHEALALLNQLRNGEASLAQVKVAQKSMQKVQDKVNKLKHNTHATMLKALTSIAQNFADQAVIVRVISLVETLLANCEAGREELRVAEENAANTWANERLPWLQAEHDSLVNSLFENNAGLDDTNNQIHDNEDFLAARQHDLDEFTQALDDENNYWTGVVHAHQARTFKLQREIDGATQAWELITNTNFSRYIHRNINEEVSEGGEVPAVAEDGEVPEVSEGGEVAEEVSEGGEVAEEVF